ncbi:YybH family protein [Salegentibacter sp. F14]
MKNLIMLSMLFLILGFKGHSQSPGATSSEVEEVIDQKTHMMVEAINGGDHEKFASFFAKDAMMKLTGTAPFEGRKAIAQAHQPMTENHMQLEIESHEIFHYGDYATETGRYKIFTPQGQEADHGHFMTLWKNTDGTWQIYRDIISSSSGD